MGTMFDCALTGSIYGHAMMQEIFGDRQRLQKWLDVEAALAEAQAAVGVIPASAAEAISRAGVADDFDLEALGAGVEGGRRHIMYTVIQALADRVGPDAGRYVHYGATTQDILDTGMILQLKDGLKVLTGELDRLCETVAQLATEHRETVMAGRTHWQHALPLTLGLKLSIVLDELMRHRQRLADAAELALVVQLYGGGGTMASLGDQAFEIEERVCASLSLGRPTSPWFASRDRTVGVVSALGMLAATLERTVLTVGRLAATEIQELAEPRRQGQVGSSTMPQKRNPVQTERTAAICKLIRGLVPVAQESAVIEHDRDMSTFMAEWFVIPQIMIMSAGAVEKTNYILSGMTVDAERMVENLALTKGGIVSEAAMFGIARHVGRMTAHDIVMRAAQRSAETGGTLFDALLADDTVREHLTREELRALLEPSNYLGQAIPITDSVVQSYARSVGR